MRREAAMSTIPNPLQNRLLAALPTEVYERLMPHLVSMHMPVGKVLYEAGNPEDYVYFPTDCIISLLYVIEDDASAEISVVGKECVFQPKPATDSTAKLPPVPRQSCHRFQ